MVNTRNNNLVINTPLPPDPIQAAITVIQETLANIQAEVRAHSTDIASLKKGEGTSQPRRTDKCKQFFKVDGVPDGRKIQFASMHMFDAALVWGLESEVGTPMRMFQANTLSESYQLARMKEATNTILKLRYNTLLLPTPKQSTTTYASKAMTTLVKFNLVGQNSGYVTTNRVHKPYRLTQKELEDKRTKGQCFYCDQKYIPGHKCSGQLHSIEVIAEGDLDNYIDGDNETCEDCMGDMVGVTDNPQITLNALSGLNSYQTIRVRGRVGKHMVYILVDCGSTHNFLDIHTAKKLGCRLDNTTHMQVSVANGQRMMSTSVCHDFKWSFQNEVFTSDVMLLPLGGCEMVLGIQWLATLRDMQCNFKKLIIKFNHKGRQLVLRGMNNTYVHWMQGKEGMLKQVELFFMALCVYPVQLCQMESIESVSAEMEQVLT
ncbi:retrotransposable element Tf2 [Tanacetum coccineum]